MSSHLHPLHLPLLADPDLSNSLGFLGKQLVALTRYYQWCGGDGDLRFVQCHTRSHFTQNRVASYILCASCPGYRQAGNALAGKKTSILWPAHEGCSLGNVLKIYLLCFEGHVGNVLKYAISFYGRLSALQIGHMRSWSGYATYRQKHPGDPDPLDDVRPVLASALGCKSDTDPVRLRYPIFAILAKHPLAP